VTAVRCGNCACGLIKIQHHGTDSIWQQIKAALWAAGGFPFSKADGNANLTAKVTGLLV